MSVTVLAIGIGVLAVVGGLLVWLVRQRRASPMADGVQEMTILVQGRYRPGAFTARAGIPLRLHFIRDEDSDCSDRVFIPDFEIEKYLPAHRTTTIELLPDREGEFLFTCKNGIYIGVIKVRRRYPLLDFRRLGRSLGPVTRVGPGASP